MHPVAVGSSRTNIRFTMGRCPRSPTHTASHVASRSCVAAWKCFSRNGFHSTSMADVIAEAGLSAGAVYLYFRSKDDIIVAVATQVFGGIQGRLLQFADHRPAAEPGGDRRIPDPAAGAGAGAGTGRSVSAAAGGLERGHPQSRPRSTLPIAILGGLREADHRHAAAVGGGRWAAAASRPTSSRRCSSRWSRASSCSSALSGRPQPTTTEPRWRRCSPRREWADDCGRPTASSAITAGSERLTGPVHPALMAMNRCSARRPAPAPR